jgi:hypothetical protein
MLTRVQVRLGKNSVAKLSFGDVDASMSASLFKYCILNTLSPSSVEDAIHQV